MPESSKPSLILNIYKPAGITSYDVIRQIKKAYKAPPYPPHTPSLKIGHAGTLDPFADGVLVVLIGNATKKASEFLYGDKTYRGVIHLGVETDTLDPTGKIVNQRPSDIPLTPSTPLRAGLPSPPGGAREVNLNPSPLGRGKGEGRIPTIHDLQFAAGKFLGEIEQIPPMYSALRWGGKRLYDLARAGQVVERVPRRVTIKKFEISNFKFPKVSFEAVVSGGTYLRVLASDFARALGTVGHLESLTRTAVGDFKIEDSIRLEDLATKDAIESLKGFAPSGAA